MTNPVPADRFEPDALARLWVESFNRRDADTLTSLAGADIEIRPTILAQGRNVYRGHDGLRVWIRDQCAATVQPKVRAAEIRLSESGDVLVFGEIIVDDEPVSPFAMRLRLEDAKVIELQAYLSDEEILTTLGLFDDDSRPRRRA